MDEDEIHWTPPTRVNSEQGNVPQHPQKATKLPSQRSRSNLLLFVLVIAFFALLWVALGRDIMNMVQ